MGLLPMKIRQIMPLPFSALLTWFCFTHILTLTAHGADDWNERAERSQQSLEENFWNERSSLFRNQFPRIPRRDNFNYWWQAQALDALIDQYERTRNKKDLDRARELFEGITKRNGKLTNDYRDDMLWLALGLLRLHDHAPDPEIKKAIDTLWVEVKKGWNESHGGGIGWRIQQPDYKALPANAPAVILAARLHQRFHRKEDLEWALKIQKWIEDTLIDPQSGFVWDGVNRRDRGQIDRHWKFTYNQGTVIGGMLELHTSTKEKKWLEKAHRTADASIKHWAEPNDGLFPENGRGDGGLFKGIIVRYLGQLIEHDPPASQKYRDLLTKNAEAVWTVSSKGTPLLFSPDWRRTDPVTSTELSSQLSAIMLFEQVARFQKEG